MFNRPIGWGISTDNKPSTGPTAWIWSFYDIYYNIGLSPTNITRTNFYNNESLSVIKTYDNEYVYGNFLRKTTHESSSGDILSTTFKYPLDFQSGNNLYSEMVQRNILYDNIEVVQEVNNNITSAQINEYILDSSSILLKRSYQLETSNTDYNYSYAQPQSGSFNGFLNKDVQMVKKIEYDLFNSRGKPLQYHSKDDIYHSIIWGYNDSYPLAVLDGISYNTANSLFLSSTGKTFSDLALLSDNDVDEATEQTLRDKLILLSSTITSDNIRVKAATFDPLIGLTSVIDSRRNTLYYKYDEFHRLKNVKDKDGNILSENEYNYTN